MSPILARCGTSAGQFSSRRTIQTGIREDPANVVTLGVAEAIAVAKWDLFGLLNSRSFAG